MIHLESLFPINQLVCQEPHPFSFLFSVVQNIPGPKDERDGVGKKNFREMGLALSNGGWAMMGEIYRCPKWLFWGVAFDQDIDGRRFLSGRVESETFAV